jgi:light-independent protochlorophyllide reductase subunit B
MFREDFEFHPEAAASHLGQSNTAAAQRKPEALKAASVTEAAAMTDSEILVREVATTTETDAHKIADASAQSSAKASAAWAGEAEKELTKIPFFVRGKARRNTERYAREKGVTTITVEVLYDAKAHFSR